MRIHRVSPAAGDACGGSFAGGGDGPACGGGAGPSTASGMLPWARGLAILSRRPFWRLAHIKKVRPGQGPGAQQKKIRDKIALFFTPVLRLEPTSTSWLRDPFTAVLEALHMNVMT